VLNKDIGLHVKWFTMPLLSFTTVIKISLSLHANSDLGYNKSLKKKKKPSK